MTTKDDHQAVMVGKKRYETPKIIEQFYASQPNQPLVQIVDPRKGFHVLDAHGNIKISAEMA